MADGTIDIDLSVDASKGISEAKAGAAKAGSEAQKSFSDKFGAGVKSFGSSLGSGLKSFASAAGKAIVAGATASAAALAALGKQSLDLYANYEQQIGGVQKLFGDAAPQVIANASEAWKTAGMNANAYMENVTSFSASLISSLGGDTTKAAEYADRALRDMSDNANTFGSNMTDIQNAYQGFAKQNYTMLDNLKLGYGGTQSEMQRLIKDASTMTDEQKKLGVQVDANSMSFGNIVNAISVMQEHMGIAGTTSKEALGTIEGSINATKAAWDNWLTGIADTNADMGTLTQNLLTGLTAVASNVIPRIAIIISQVVAMLPEMMQQIGTAITQAIPQIMEQVNENVNGNLPAQFATLIAQILVYITQGVGQVVQALVAAIPTLLAWFLQFLPQLLAALTDVVAQVAAALPGLIQQVCQVIVDNMPAILDAAAKLFGEILTGLVNCIPSIIQGLVDLLVKLVQYVVDRAPEMLTKALEFFGKILTAITQSLPSIFQGAVKIVSKILEGLASLPGKLLAKGGEAMNSLLNGIKNKYGSITGFVSSIPGKIVRALGSVGSLLWNAGASIINGFLRGLKSSFNSVKSFVWGIGDWIAANKGPLPYDRKLLIPAGEAITGGLEESMRKGFERVKRGVSTFNSDLAGVQFDGLSLRYQGQPQGQAAAVTQTINFNTPVATPDIIADEMKSVYYYGLAAEYTS